MSRILSRILIVPLPGNKEYTPTYVYEYNFKHEHTLNYLDPAKPGARKVPEHALLKHATHAAELSMMFPALEDVLGPLSEEEVTGSRKFVKFLFQFAVRGHPKQDGKYEFRDWEPVMDGAPSPHSCYIPVSDFPNSEIYFLLSCHFYFSRLYLNFL